jgi:hypothetical protein
MGYGTASPVWVPDTRPVGRINANGMAAKRQEGVLLKITATDCDAVRRPADGWQKDGLGRKIGIFQFFRSAIFLPETPYNIFLHTSLRLHVTIIYSIVK